MKRTFILRHRMLQVMQNIVYYLSFEVLEPNWLKLMTKLRSVSTVDEVSYCYCCCCADSRSSFSSSKLFLLSWIYNIWIVKALSYDTYDEIILFGDVRLIIFISIFYNILGFVSSSRFSRYMLNWEFSVYWKFVEITYQNDDSVYIVYPKNG